MLQALKTLSTLDVFSTSGDEKTTDSDEDRFAPNPERVPIPFSPHNKSKLTLGTTLTNVALPTPLPLDYDTAFDLAPPLSWSHLEPATFDLRIGPNYRPRSGQKAPSGPCMYDITHIDFFISTQKIVNVTRFFDLNTWLQTESTVSTVPEFVVQVQYLPLGGRGTARSGEDGNTAQFISWCRLNESIRDIVLAYENRQIGYNDLPPNVKLWAGYLANARGATWEHSWMSRWKTVKRFLALDGLGVPSAVVSQLKKFQVPVLARPNTLEVKFDDDASLVTVAMDHHQNTRLAKWILSGSCDGWKNAVVDIGFVIEGREDRELPEQMLMGFRLSKVDVDRAPIFPVEYFTQDVVSGEAEFVPVDDCVAEDELGICG